MLNKFGEDVINSDALKFYRKRENYTSQVKLAEVIGCSVDQVNRWERSKSPIKPRQRSIEKLCDVLKVSWEELTTQPPEGKSKEQSDPSWDPTIQLNRRVRLSTRTAMEYVSKEYGVRWRDILELAPLLFMIFAQQSLKAREKDLDKLVEQIEESAVSINSTIPYMTDNFFINSENDWICEERNSIKHNEIFKSYDNEDGEYQSPFVNDLKKYIEASFPSEVDIRPNDHVEEQSPFANHSEESPSSEVGIRPNSHSAPDYSIPIKFLDKMLEISDKDIKNGNAILLRIQEGHLDLQEVLSKKKELETESYQSWLDNKYQEVEAKIKSAEDDFLKGLNL